MSHVPSPVPELHAIARLLDLRADFIDGEPYGSGRINDTYFARFDQAGLRPLRYILQRINTNAFKTPAGAIPERVTHNDTKLNNVLLDDATAEGVCVIDFDTTMPGPALYDFGDMVRTATPTTREDATDLDNLDLRIDRFKALVRGYLSSAGAFLNPAEIENLAFSGKLPALECGIRFLTDSLSGDVDFKIKRPDHNLDRCRNPFAFVAAIENRLPEMEKLVAVRAGVSRTNESRT